MTAWGGKCDEPNDKSAFRACNAVALRAQGVIARRDEMGINAKMVVSMMLEAGMGDNAIAVALSALKPIATFDRSPYYDPNTVSRYIRRNAM